MARLDGIQRTLCKRYSPYLWNLEKKVTNEYNNILAQEELFWKQESRNLWLQEGDKNTKNFHLSTIVKIRRNKLEGLENEVGQWIDSKEDMKEIVIRYFENILSTKS